MPDGSLRVATDQVAPTPFEIPGATGGTFRIQILNQDQAAGVVTTIVHIPAGGRIPAHRHQAGAEMHFLLEGDLIEAGEPVAPGTCLTHAAGVVHGPHESRGGARLLTVQSWQSRHGDFDFEPAEDEAAAGKASDGTQPAPGARKVDEAAQADARREAADPSRRGYA
ncbi:cupin domain-containing protein [Falsiroseomonas selenitidurans]|uniref:ChrR-like cupin domain-containing protein n=1 Tax=Falsiroseomonas selenitidurans TaxID=2716335 RepID=A0ABX1E5R2_9PROT|nr:cupin domain-containing protein [Falsiroseomonas selenitidurans]NKC32522.1 hypothetical protein [Falsiroseomonas selenitidurans]